MVIGFADPETLPVHWENTLPGLGVAAKETLVPAAMRGSHSEHRRSYTSRPLMRPMGIGLELKAQRKDGSLFPVEISLSPNRVDEGLRVIALVRDISDRELSEELIRERLAKRKTVEVSTLVRMWVIESMRREAEQP